MRNEWLRTWKGGRLWNVFVWFLIITGILIVLGLGALHACAEISDDIDDITDVWR